MAEAAAAPAPKKEKPKEKKKPTAYKPGRMCPKCGSRMAEHADRFACGKCGYAEFKSAKK